jgi:hypothetical protein
MLEVVEFNRSVEIYRFNHFSTEAVLLNLNWLWSLLQADEMASG